MGAIRISLSRNVAVRPLTVMLSAAKHLTALATGPSFHCHAERSEASHCPSREHLSLGMALSDDLNVGIAAPRRVHEVIR